MNKKKNLCAHEIWKLDVLKIEKLIQNDYNVLIVWEYDYNLNRKNELNKIKEFIVGKNKNINIRRSSIDLVDVKQGELLETSTI